MSAKLETTHIVTENELVVYRRERSSIWQCRYKVGGVWQRASTKERKLKDAKEIAKELKLTISSTELEKAKADLISKSGGQEALATNLVAAQIAPSNFDRYVRAILTSNKIQEALAASGVPADEVSSRVTQLVNAKAAELTVKVNPRYGTWDADTGDIVASDSAGSAVVPSGK